MPRPGGLPAGSTSLSHLKCNHSVTLPQRLRIPAMSPGGLRGCRVGRNLSLCRVLWAETEDGALGTSGTDLPAEILCEQDGV